MSTSTSRNKTSSAPLVSSTSPILTLPPYTTTSIPRLQSLYSDISRQKHSNPTSYHANVEWWFRALEGYVSSGLQHSLLGGRGSRLVLSAGQPLMENVRVDGVGKPLALGAVITELCHSKSLIPLSQFLSSKESVYDSGWLLTRIATYVVAKPLWWALERLGIVNDESASTGRIGSTEWWGEYVILALVEKVAHSALLHQRSKPGGPGDGLYTMEGFMKEFSHVLDQNSIGDVDMKVLLRYLERDRRVVLIDTRRNIVKFVATDASPEAQEITVVDQGILELKTAVENTHAQLDSIQHKIHESVRKASGALQQKQRAVALSYLRSKKHLDDLLTKRLESLEVLEATLIRVEAAAGDVEIMKTYESSTATLRAILAHPSLQREKIDETMDAMAQATADAREVEEAMKIGGDIAMGVDNVIDDAELERELSLLVSEVEGERREEDTKLEKLLRIERTPIGTPLSESECLASQENIDSSAATETARQPVAVPENVP